jgi:hypothetical protein
LAAAKTEIERVKSANAELEKQLASWGRDSRSATEAARDNMILMEETIEELKAALGVAEPEKAAPALKPQAKPEPAKDERSAATRAPAGDERSAEPPAAKARAPAPEPGRRIGAGQSSGSPTELSDAELSEWRANVIGR